MSALPRFGHLVRDIVRVLRGLPPDEAVRQRTIAINEQIVRLRQARLVQEKQREQAALKEVEFVVEEMKRLKESLIAAESAAVEFVNQIGDQAQSQLEDEWNKKAETVITKVMTQQTIEVETAPLSAASSPAEVSQVPVSASNTTTVVLQTTPALEK